MIYLLKSGYVVLNSFLPDVDEVVELEASGRFGSSSVNPNKMPKCFISIPFLFLASATNQYDVTLTALLIIGKILTLPGKRYNRL